MRLIETETLAMESHVGRDIPPYAILSHTWEDEEVTLQDWNSWRRNRMKGFQKISMTCKLAASDGIDYAWVDTCCIDKSNSAELSEAINTMYRWYKGAEVCYAYLSDLHLSTPEPGDSIDLASSLSGCRWFSRGWTLQELIAPANIRFYQHNWDFAGTKSTWSRVLSDLTGISYRAFSSYNPADYSIAERMSRAANRHTTREEDIAYCLLGIFDINMPMLYGEGAKAFRRLQEEIIRTGYDVSIFAWTKTLCSDEGFTHGAFANAPEDFHSISGYLMKRQWNEVSVTNTGIKLNLELCLVRTPQTGKLSYVLPICAGGWRPTRRGIARLNYVSALGVGLTKISPGRFMRSGLDQLVEMPKDGEAGTVDRIRCPNAYILIDSPPSSLSDLRLDHEPCFEFSPGCRVVRAWPSGSWNDEVSKFMAVASEPNYGSFLVEVQASVLDDDRSVRPCRTGEFMFLFSSLHSSDVTAIEESQLDLKYTIVGYREHQLMLDIINLRMGAGDMDVEEMRRTLRNFAIPRQRTAAVHVEGTEQSIYTSVDFYWEDRYIFKSSCVALENKEQPWGTETWI
ncbi:Vegetative incompatibility protein HET-E-1 [Colletotrichum sp. SAR 10_65]|nr:Vegetative incompatibility protein HET-E-1 [Colletotrichum sp. SAR 10_65]